MKRNKKVLIVDDDEMVLFLHEFYVKETLHFDELLKFNSAEAALSYLAINLDNNSNYLVFLDINMPTLSGWDFLESIKSDSYYAEKLHVVMVTSSIDGKDKERSSLFSNIVAFIEKPFTSENCQQLKEKPSLQLYFQ